jgi:NADH-quinone oxidoreductase subunit A
VKSSKQLSEIGMLAEYIGVALMLLMAIGIAVGMVFMTSILGPKRYFADKMEPFECGESQLVSPHQRFSVKFYLVAVLFVLFDIEAVFFFPWAVLFKRLGVFGFVEMLLFIIILGVGLLYVWKRGGLDWE